jgi:hypothetical protein
MSGARHISFSLSALGMELLNAVEKTLIERIPMAVVFPVPAQGLRPPRNR